MEAFELTFIFYDGGETIKAFWSEKIYKVLLFSFLSGTVRVESTIHTICI